MIIKLFYCIRLKDGRRFGPGTFDDSKNKFPQELYDEISLFKNRERRTRILEIIEDTEESGESAWGDELTTLDSGEDAVETEEKVSRRANRKRTKGTSVPDKRISRVNK